MLLLYQDICRIVIINLLIMLIATSRVWCVGYTCLCMYMFCAWSNVLPCFYLASDLCSSSRRKGVMRVIIYKV